MSNNEALRLAEVLLRVADEYIPTDKNFIRGSAFQLEHDKYRDKYREDLEAASVMLGRIAELEAALISIAADVSSGLCCFTREGMRAALGDIQKQTDALGYDVLGERKPDHE